MNANQIILVELRMTFKEGVLKKAEVSEFGHWITNDSNAGYQIFKLKTSYITVTGTSHASYCYSTEDLEKRGLVGVYAIGEKSLNKIRKYYAKLRSWGYIK